VFESRNVASCITQLPDEDAAAVARCCALEIKTLSSAMLPPLACIDPNPFPGLAVPALTDPAPNTNSFTNVGVATLLSSVVPAPVFADVTSSGEI
jgi:hypothetical protein